MNARLETDRHPCRAFILSGDKWFIKSVLYQTNKTRRGVIILRRWKANFNESCKPVFHPTNGREAGTATLL